MASYTSTAVFNGLGNFPMGVPAAGDYSVSGSLLLPSYISNTIESEVVVTVKINNGTTIFTGTPGNKGFEVKAVMSAGDIFNVILSSNSASDKQFNVVKSTLTVSQI